MRISISSLKPFALCLATVALMAFGHDVAKADEVTIAGYMNGCFNCNPPPAPNTSAVQTATLSGLVYTNSQFNGTSSLGNLGLGSNPAPMGVQNFNNFGSFTLANSLANYNGNTFTLSVSFTLPTGINGAQQVYTATFLGAVSGTGTSGVNIDFDNTPSVLTFSNANGSGSFNLIINDVTINPGQTASLNAFIRSAAQSSVPEPAGMILLGGGLLGMAGIARRRCRR